MMLSSMDSAVVDEQTALMQLDAIWQQIQQRMEAEKQRIYEEIRQYPSPIPACDDQFNGLLEERATILQALGQVQDARKQSLTIHEHVALLNELVRSSRHLDREIEGNIRQLVTTLSGADQNQ